MSHIRTLSRILVVLALLGAALALAASPASAQEIQVIVIETVDDDDAATSWQTRVKVQSLGGCTPEQGLGAAGYESTWFREGGQVSATLNVATCSYSITAQARRTTSEVCNAELAWGTSPGDTDYHDSLNSATRTPTTETRISVRAQTRDVDGVDVPICAAAVTATFTIDPELVVEGLPSSSLDDNFEARVQRAVEVSDFDVRVRPDSSTKNDRGCNVLLAFTMQGGEDGEVKRNFEGIPIGEECKFRVSIVDAPDFIEISDSDKTFETDDTSKTVELGGLLTIDPARIAIIQDVAGDAGDAGVSYSIVRSCAGVDSLPTQLNPSGGLGVYQLPGGQWRVSLTEGRFTVHSDRTPTFGPGVTYHAAARSLTSSTVSGCSVTVTIENVPNGCAVAGGHAQTLTWRESRPFDNFDFEFDITCGGATTRPSADGDLPPAPPPSTGDTSQPSTGDTSVDAVVATPDVRIVARLLDNGKIEFGLQQWQYDDSWSARRFPRARLFPADTAVGRWLASSAITLNAAETEDSFDEDVVVRIIARRLETGRVEFGLQQQENGSWSDRLLPTRRFFPASTTIDRWLGSSTESLDL